MKLYNVRCILVREDENSKVFVPVGIVVFSESKDAACGIVVNGIAEKMNGKKYTIGPIACEDITDYILRYFSDKEVTG
jgi:hypothetical protein